MPRLQKVKSTVLEVCLFITLLALVGHVSINFWERFVLQPELLTLKHSLHSLRNTIKHIGNDYIHLYSEMRYLTDEGKIVEPTNQKERLTRQNAARNNDNDEIFEGVKRTHRQENQFSKEKKRSHLPEDQFSKDTKKPHRPDDQFSKETEITQRKEDQFVQFAKTKDFIDTETRRNDFSFGSYPEINDYGIEDDDPMDIINNKHQQTLSALPSHQPNNAQMYPDNDSRMTEMGDTLVKTTPIDIVENKHDETQIEEEPQYVKILRKYNVDPKIVSDNYKRKMQEHRTNHNKDKYCTGDPSDPKHYCHTKF